MPPASIASFFTPDSTTTRTTRKRPLNTGADTSDIHNNDTDSDDAGDAPNASKSAKTTPKKPAGKKAAVKKTPAKTAGKKATPAKGSKTPAKLYKDTIASVDKTSRILGKAGANTDATAAAMHKVLPSVSELLAFDTPTSTKNAFVLALHIAEHAVADLDGHLKACGYGDHEGPFKAMDTMLLKVIEQRVKEETTECAVLQRKKVAVEGTGAAAFAQDKYEGVNSGREPENYYEFEQLLGKWPNKQERNMVDRYRREGVIARAETRRERREQEADDAWVSNGLADSMAWAKYVDGYGLDNYLQKSIEKLQQLLDA